MNQVWIHTKIHLNQDIRYGLYPCQDLSESWNWNIWMNVDIHIKIMQMGIFFTRSKDFMCWPINPFVGYFMALNKLQLVYVYRYLACKKHLNVSSYIIIIIHFLNNLVIWYSFFISQIACFKISVLVLGHYQVVYVIGCHSNCVLCYQRWLAIQVVANWPLPTNVRQKWN